MNIRLSFALGLSLATLAASPHVGAADNRRASDIVPTAKRQETVDKALRLAQPPAPVPLPDPLPLPFTPPDFDKRDPEEAKSNPVTPGAAAAQQPAPVAGDREILETLAGRLTPSGTLSLGGAPQLIIGRNRFPVGTRFTVTYNNEDFELELVAIDRTTFTLRFRNEEITRPIKPAR